MHAHDIRTRLGEAARAHATWGEGDADVAAMEQHASEGCSVCARALVNGREMAVLLAQSEAPATGVGRSLPSAASRIAAHVRGTMDARKAAAAPADERVRALDPSATVARRHIRLPGEAARIREIDALRATEGGDRDGASRLLEQLSRFLDFELLFVSVVRGERAVARAQRGLAPEQAAFRELRREMSYCTHTVSGEGPLVIENALAEPFFRGNKAATRFGMAAYVGVPLRTTAGVVVGTLCALSPRPRAIPPETVALLSVLARRAVAEIERERTPELLCAVVEASSDRGDVYSETFFRDLIAAQSARDLRRSRSSSILVMRAESAETVLDWIEAHETAGRLAPDEIGLLLPGVDVEAAAGRLARLPAVASARAAPLSATRQRPGAVA